VGWFSITPVSFAQASGYVFPNEHELQWSALIVLYPYLTGLVAGAFILASLVRVFSAQAVAPVYRLALLTALAFLICAPLPLVAHLGHPERAYHIMITPHMTSAMAIFGYVYLWYLMAVLLLEIWFDYRKDLVEMSRTAKAPWRHLYSALTLGVKDLSPKALAFDDKAGRFVTIIGIPSAVLLHGYVGFIFGSLKGNPWWSSVLMPVIFILSAIVSGIALVMVLYLATSRWRGQRVNVPCVDAIARYLMFALVFDLTLGFLDIVHRLYEAGEWIEVLALLSSGYLFTTIFVMQLFVGGLVPLAMLGYAQVFRPASGRTRLWINGIAGVLALLGVLFMRWNVVIGGQLFSKSLQGLTTYKLEMAGQEGLLIALGVLALPFVILFGLVKLLPPWPEEAAEPEMDRIELQEVAQPAV
jgi:Ni/Fe-hydrogenase subunit HybB-like protein